MCCTPQAVYKNHYLRVQCVEFSGSSKSEPRGSNSLCCSDCRFLLVLLFSQPSAGPASCPPVASSRVPPNVPNLPPCIASPIRQTATKQQFFPTRRSLKGFECNKGGWGLPWFSGFREGYRRFRKVPEGFREPIGVSVGITFNKELGATFHLDWGRLPI